MFSSSRIDLGCFRDTNLAICSKEDGVLFQKSRLVSLAPWFPRRCAGGVWLQRCRAGGAWFTWCCTDGAWARGCRTVDVRRGWCCLTAWGIRSPIYRGWGNCRVRGKQVSVLARKQGTPSSGRRFRSIGDGAVKLFQMHFKIVYPSILLRSGA